MISTTEEMTNFTFKIDKKTRESYSALCEAFGLSMSAATLALVRQAVRSQSMTFTMRDEGWLKNMAGMSAAGTTVIPETQDRIVTLSTCTEDSAKRMTVQGKLIWKGSPYGQKQNNTEAQGAA